jgi:hypothetical protein
MGQQPVPEGVAAVAVCGLVIAAAMIVISVG